MTSIQISSRGGHGHYTGRSIDSIVRREYGRTAQARKSPDPNNPHWGMVVRPSPLRRAAGRGVGTVKP